MTLLDIANLAINYLGIGKKINSLDENSEEASAAKDCIYVAIDTVLSEGIWGFNIYNRYLAILKQENNKYYFKLDNDVLKILNVVDENGNEVEYHLESVDGVSCLVCDLSVVSMNYIKKRYDVEVFPIHCNLSISYFLAYMIGLRLTGKMELGQKMLDFYYHFLNRGLSIDYNNRIRDRYFVEDSEFIKVRG